MFSSRRNAVRVASVSFDIQNCWPLAASAYCSGLSTVKPKERISLQQGVILLFVNCVDAIMASVRPFWQQRDDLNAMSYV